MSDSSPVENDFLSKITALVEENISNEQFGVSELAEAMHMSRSNLLRKVKKLTNLSVSQLISQVRLKQAMELLRKSSLNVSEVSLKVGFGSTSYFIKCFREHYGYPPGEVGKRSEAELNAVPVSTPVRKPASRVFTVVGLVAAVAIGFLVYYVWPVGSSSLEKSIAVLPFKNDSNDSTNVYLINGLMESTLNNLQKISDLKVISRTSAEKYRNTSKSIPEMAKELHVSYFIEGSGQKIGDRILLNIQLIEAHTDRHLWAKQYKRESNDIFQLQQEIAKDIAEEIQAIITPEEQKRIEKIPTKDLVAYDYYLKGIDLMAIGGDRNLMDAIQYFEKAIARDKDFSLAYASIAACYYYLDMFRAEKTHTAEIGNNADKALLIDSRLGENLVAKALYYTQTKEYDLAISYLEKALEYNPNSIRVINQLADIYCNHTPNTSKYLEYALKGVKLDDASLDSNATSYNYLRLSNALIQTGFVDESLKYMDKSLEYNPNNYFSRYVKVFILFAKDRDCKLARDRMIEQFQKDTTRLDIMQEVGKLSYLLRDYKEAYRYYKPFIEIREAQQLDIYKHENLRIGIVLAEMGFKEKANEFAESFKQYADNDRSIYKHLALSEYYSYKGNIPKALEHARLFAKEDNYQYWILLWDMETGVDPVKSHPEFRKIMKEVEAKFWASHEEIKVMLEEKGLL